MAIIRGDRIGDGRKTSPLTAAQQDAYARFVATLPDDFGRVRLSWPLIVGAMYPREENPRRVASLAGRWRRFADAFEAAGLLKVWEDDGIRWAEVVGWKASQHKRGQAFHRTPEPPWGGHVHTGWCASTAIARLRDVGRRADADALSIWLKELRVRERYVKGDVKGGFTSPPSLPSLPPPPPPEEQRIPDAAAPGTLFPTETPPKRAKPDPTPAWSREACDDWIARYGGTAPGGVIGKNLKPLVGQHGWESVRSAWRAYLAETEAEYASAARFASTYGRWSGTAPPARAAPARATVGDRTRAALDRFAERRRDGGTGQAIDVEATVAGDGGAGLREGPHPTRGELPAGARRPDP